MAGALLVVDEDPVSRAAVADRLDRLGYEVFREAGGPLAFETYERTRPDAVLLALHYPGPASTLGYDEFRRRGAVLILLLGHGFAEADVRAMQLGAEKILTKPMEMAHLEAVTARVLEKLRTCRRCGFLRARTATQVGRDPLGVSPAMRALAQRLRELAAAGDSVVLLTGEPGTGKGWVARLIHDASPRAEAPFVEALCSTSDADAFVAEVFGVETGGDAGPRSRKPGLFELADRGTLFLDEIGAVPPAVQPALLEALETRVVRRAGGARALHVDVRPIAATCEDVGAAIRRGQFGEDLFRRLNVVPVHLPPLRERAREDREALARRVFADLRGAMPGSPGTVAEETLRRFAAHPWPGNLRELRNVMERALLLARDAAVLGPEHLPAELGGHAAPAAAASAEPEPAVPPAPPAPEPASRASGPSRQPPVSLEEVERRHIERTLRRHGGNRTRAAEELGISRATLINKIKLYGLGEVR